MTVVYEYVNKRDNLNTSYEINVAPNEYNIRVEILKDGELWTNTRVKGDDVAFQTFVYSPTIFEKIRGITHAKKIKKAVDNFKNTIDCMFTECDSKESNIQKNQKYIDENLESLKV